MKFARARRGFLWFLCGMDGYFDHNATTPLHPAARRAWLETADRFWHNPSSLYQPAGEARRLLEDCRERAAALLDCDPESLIFCSGATEANNFIIRHFCETEDGAVLASAVEHPSLREAVTSLSSNYQLIPCLENGVTDLEEMKALAEKRRPALVSMMAANNETGVLQPWREALEFCRGRGVPFHCDAAQWVGKLPAGGLGECDFLTVSAHKFGGPKGVGLLKVPAERRFRSLRGGPQEDRRRAGTENLAGIAAMLAAWEAREASLEAAARDGAPARRAFEEEVKRGIPGLRVVAEEAPRLWNTALLLVPGPAGNVKWLARLSAKGFCVSTGSACSRGEGASDVLIAMGRATEDLGRTLRVSAGPETAGADWRALARAMIEVSREIGEAPAAKRRISL